MNQDFSPGIIPSNNTSTTIRMERPKSAKHNIERLKKSFYLKRNSRNVPSSSSCSITGNDIINNNTNTNIVMRLLKIMMKS